MRTLLPLFLVAALAACGDAPGGASAPPAWPPAAPVAQGAGGAGAQPGGVAKGATAIEGAGPAAGEGAVATGGAAGSVAVPDAGGGVAVPDATINAGVPSPPDAGVHDGGAGASEAVVLNRTAEPKGAAIYDRLCVLCHGDRGQGYAADNAPSLISASFRETADDEFLRRAITSGRPGTAMAAYGAEVGGPLARPDVDALVAYLRTNAPPVIAREAPAVAGDAEKGAPLFAERCQGCHGTREQRSNSVHLFNPMLMATASDAFLRHAILAGRPGTRMMAWRGVLEEAQIADLIAFLRSRALPLVAAPDPGAMPPAAPRTGPVVVNPKGKQARFTLKDDRLVSIDDVKKALDQKRRLVICDARAPSEWMALHIEGAISTPYYDKPSLDDVPNDGTWIIAYCACPHHASGEVVDELRRRGYAHTAVLDEGVFAWQHKGYPVVTAPGGLPTAAPPGMVDPLPPTPMPAIAVPAPAPAPAAPAPAVPSPE